MSKRVMSCGFVTGQRQSLHAPVDSFFGAGFRYGANCDGRGYGDGEGGIKLNRRGDGRGDGRFLGAYERGPTTYDCEGIATYFTEQGGEATIPTVIAFEYFQYYMLSYNLHDLLENL